MNEVEPALFADMRARMAAEPWCLDIVEIVGADVHLVGWAIPVGGDPGVGSIAINGVAARQQRFGSLRQDVGDIYPFAPNAAFSGFSASGGFDPDGRHIQIDYVDAATLRPVCGHHSFFVPLAPEDLPIPDPTHRTRTTGPITDVTFKYGGYTLVRKLDALLLHRAGHGFGGFRSVLDWGAGCGRLSRYILRELGPDARLTIADIDADNVGWCERNIPAATSVVLPLMPPSPLPGNGFDVIIGNSVFTHLQEGVQFAWLEELKRVASRGAYILVTIHNVKDMFRATNSLDNYSKLLSQGFVDEFPDHSLDGKIPESGYYRGAFHTHEYIWENWSKILEVEDILTDYSNNSQDLVILRKV